ncbi:MAG TPA: hypothetical protein VFJ22_16620 [Dermatophilaceae bacterium]|nr:hypothetical protein [Dermatophilaceae bacterium]
MSASAPEPPAFHTGRVAEAVVPAEDLPLLRGEALSGRLLQQMVLAAALWVVLASVACGALALAGVWQPVVGLTALLVAAAAAWRVTNGLPSRALPLWVAAALVAIAVGSGVWASMTHSEQVLPRRDSASYLQSAIDLATHHRRPISVDVDSIGGPDVLRIPGVTLASPAFYQTGSAADPAIQPQFMVGPSAVYSAAWWVGGPKGAFLAPAWAAALAVLAIGVLVATTLGPRWSPLAAFSVALTFPWVHTARSTYSEPLAMLVLLGGLLGMAVAGRRTITEVASRRAGLLGGVLVGGTALVRADGLRETILVLPVVALSAVQRRPFAKPLLMGAGIATAVAVAAGLALSSQYLGSIAGSLVPLVGLGVVMAILSWAGIALARRGLRLPALVQAWLPRTLAGVVLLVGVALASRPLWQVVRQSPDDPGSHVVAGLQQRQGLPIDGGRTYAEHTVTWLAWWVGPLALVIALVVLAALAHRGSSRWVEGRRLAGWVGPLIVASGSTLLTLYRPGITPDHPWADRRLLFALPLVAVLVTCAAATLTRRATRRMPVPFMAVVSVGTSLALLVPTAMATWPHRAERVEAGELAAVDAVCRSVAPGDLLLMVDSRAANEWPPVLRGQCGVQALSTTSALRSDPAALRSAVAQVRAAASSRGHRLVLLAADSPASLAALGAGGIRQVANTSVLEDPRLLERRPDHLVTLRIDVWLGTPASR